MRIIIKPLGFVVVLTATACITILPRLSMVKKATLPQQIAAPSSPDTKIASLQDSETVDQANPAPTESLQPLTLEDSAWEAYADPGSAIERRSINVDKPSLKNAYRFEIGSIGANAWCVGYHNRVTGNFPEARKVTVTFWARADQEREIILLGQSTQSPYPVDSQISIHITPEWKEYTEELSLEPHLDGSFYLSFQFGQTKTAVEIADIRLN